MTMRFESLATAYLVGLGLVLAACGDDGTTGGSGGDGGSGGATGGTSNTGGATTNTGGGLGTGGDFPCPPDTCEADEACLSIVDNSASTKPGLRMTYMNLTSPPALAAGLVSAVVKSSVLPNYPACDVEGSASFSWLFQFDTAAGTVKTGGAKPVADPTTGYAFVNEVINGFQVVPLTLNAAVDAQGKFNVTQSGDVIVPVFLDPQATQVLMLPLRRFVLQNGTLSSDKGCIGRYNAANIDPEEFGCSGSDATPPFVTGAELEGIISLEEADGVAIEAIGQSLCVLLSNDPATYGDGVQPIQKCKRTGGVIDFKGDTCTAAGGNCTDAVTLKGNFAASGVPINN